MKVYPATFYYRFARATLVHAYRANSTPVDSRRQREGKNRRVSEPRIAAKRCTIGHGQVNINCAGRNGCPAGRLALKLIHVALRAASVRRTRDKRRATSAIYKPGVDVGVKKIGLRGFSDDVTRRYNGIARVSSLIYFSLKRTISFSIPRIRIFILSNFDTRSADALNSPFITLLFSGAVQK